MPRLACVGCGQFFHIKKNGVVIEEGMPDGNGGWGPYKLWAADLYECRRCGTTIAAGFAREPFAEHYQFDYQAARERNVPLATINDCGG